MKETIQFKQIYLLIYALCFSQFTQAQSIGSKEIIGQVKGEDNMPLFGAHVQVEGTTIGTATDYNGEFRLSIPDSTKLLAFSMTGFRSQSLDVTTQSQLEVSLKEDSDLLSEVVVIGYGTQRKDDLTGSVSSVSNKHFENQPITRVDNILSGRAAGVQVAANSGAPGGNIKIRIRGANSITGNNQPLIVIDGVIGADMQLINPTDIQSMEVLKDASATAIYGSRGANGVVLITTKKGTKDRTVVQFNSFYSVSTLPKKINYLSAGEFAELYNDYDREIYYNPPFPYQAPFTDTEVARFESEGGTDWQDEIFRTAHSQNYEISVNGGNDKVSYYLSSSYLDQEGILINTGFTRFNLRSKLDIELSDKWNLNMSILGSRQKGLNNDFVGSQFGAIGRMPQWVATENVWDDNNEFYNNSPNQGAVTGNPVGLQMTQNSEVLIDNYVPSGALSFQVIPDLNLKLSGAIDIRNTAHSYFNDNYLLQGASGITSAGINTFRQTRSQYSMIANYQKEFGLHRVGLTAIYEGTAFKDEGSFAEASDLNSPALGYYNLALSGSQRASSYYYDEYLSSIAFRFNYTLAHKYMLTATLRRDGSSKFVGDNQFSLFPSVALAWHLGDETFVKNLGVFSTLKWRASYGQTGNQGVGSYATLPYFVQNPTVDYSPAGPTSPSVTGLGVGSPGNAALKWETTTQLDVGLELGFVQDRVRLEFDYYQKNTNDLLLNYQLPFYAGNGTIVSNIGEVSNKGIELVVSAIPVNNSWFKWDMAFNLSINRNEVLDLGEETEIFPGTRYADADAPLNIIKEGEPLGSFYGYKYEGVWKSSESEQAALFGNVPGDAKYHDLNGDNIIDSEDLQLLGSAQPDFIYGISNTFKIKDFDLSVLIQGVQGGQVYNGMYQKSVGLFGQSQAFTSPDHYDRWTPTNEESNIPAFSTSSQLFSNSSRWLQDGSYVRLKNITLAYNVPVAQWGGIFSHLSRLQLYVSGDNLWTRTSYTGYDPEASSAGNTVGGGSNTDVDQNIDTGAYPNPRTMIAGIKIGF